MSWHGFSRIKLPAKLQHASHVVILPARTPSLRDVVRLDGHNPTPALVWATSFSTRFHPGSIKDTRWSDVMYVNEPGRSPIPDYLYHLLYPVVSFQLKSLTSIAQPLRFQLEYALWKTHVRVHVRTCIRNNPQKTVKLGVVVFQLRLSGWVANVVEYRKMCANVLGMFLVVYSGWQITTCFACCNLPARTPSLRDVVPREHTQFHSSISVGD